MIRRRSSQKPGKDTQRDENAPAPFFNFDNPAPVEEGPLFNLEEMHERRILSWSPEPEEFFDTEPRTDAEPTRSEREETARSVYERPPAVEPEPPRAAVAAPPPVAPAQPVAAPPRVVAAPASPPVQRPIQPPPASEPVREVAPQVAPAAPAPAVEAPVAAEADDEGAAPAQAGAKKRGRPRGRPRRQVHFHVDPDEERLLMAAVERYGSQQKGLIAALESLHEAEMLRDEIERLRAEVARHRRLLDEAESLFSR